MLSIGTEFVPLSFSQVNVTTSATELIVLSPRPARARHATLYPEDDVRMRCDGTDPTQAIGIVLSADLHVFENQRTMLDKMVLISGTGSTVKLNIEWYE